MVLLRKYFLEVCTRMIRGHFLPPLLEGQGLQPCLVNSVLGFLEYFLGGEGNLAALYKLYCIFHALKVDTNGAVKLYRLRQGLSECLKIRCPNIPIPLHEVIHEVF